MQEVNKISKFVSNVFRYDTNNMAGYQESGVNAFEKDGQCTPSCCEKEQEK